MEHHGIDCGGWCARSLKKSARPRDERGHLVAARRPRAYFRKRTHRRPSRRANEREADWTAAGFEAGRWLIDLGSALKPHAESGNGEQQRLGFRKRLHFSEKQKTHSRAGSGF